MFVVTIPIHVGIILRLFGQNHFTKETIFRSLLGMDKHGSYFCIFIHFVDFQTYFMARDPVYLHLASYFNNIKTVSIVDCQVSTKGWSQLRSGNHYLIHWVYINDERGVRMNYVSQSSSLSAKTLSCSSSSLHLDVFQSDILLSTTRREKPSRNCIQNII